jgi:subtilisin family serine protease
MKKTIDLLFLVFLIQIFFSTSSFAADRYWVFFVDKGIAEELTAEQKQTVLGSSVSARSFQRRLRRSPKAYSNSLTFQELPVSKAYVDSLKSLGFRVYHKLRWFNAVSGYAKENILNQIAKFPFVRKVEQVKRFVKSDDSAELQSPTTAFSKSQSVFSHDLDYGPSFNQMDFHRIPEVHDRGFTGDGIRVGLFDTGFNLNHPALQHLNQRVFAEWDFVNSDSITKNQPGDPIGQDSHGSLVLSTIAGLASGQLIGPAFNAEYVLAKTEADNYERHIEEDNWAAAAQWADSLGVDIVSTSVGYSEFEPGEPSYIYEDMDGQTTIITLAANFLTNRGVVVVASAGNEGNSTWRFITAPSDGRNVICVGAVNSSNNIASFSSRGPTSDGRVKPDVVGIGVGVLAANPASQGYPVVQGTSFSCPIVAGICALLLEEFPDLTVLQILTIIRDSGDNPSPDFERGWGRVDAMKAREIAAGKTKPVEVFSVKLLGKKATDPSTLFEIDLPTQSPINISIYNVIGQKVKTINSDGLFRRNYIDWDHRNDFGNLVASGIYVYRVETNFGVVYNKFVIVR